jgi:N-acetylmuramoyl-L-alanine amidase
MGQPITVQWIPDRNPAGPLQMSARQAPVRLVVIDPGHGGDDEGARGPGGLEEKNLTLKLAQMLRSELARDRALRVVLTREADTQVELGKRAELANHLQADLFISLHANAAKSIGAAGFETFFLSLSATDDESRKLAALENVALGVKAAPDSRASDLELILGDMAQAEHLADSEAFATLVQERLSQVMQTENRGVKQAPFRVLMQAAMPAVLVEVGFLSNKDEARSITRPETQAKIVQALAESVFSFRDRQARQLGVKQ